MKRTVKAKLYILAVLFGLMIACAAALPASAATKTNWKKVYGEALKKTYITYSYKSLNKKGRAVSKKLKVYPSYKGTRYRTLDIDQDGTPELIISQTYSNGTSALFVFKASGNKLKSCYLAGKDLKGDYGLIRNGKTKKITYVKDLHALDITYTYTYTQKKTTVTQTRRNIIVLKGNVFSTYAYAMSYHYVPVNRKSSSGTWSYYVWLKPGEYKRTSRSDPKLDYTPSTLEDYRDARKIVFNAIEKTRSYSLLKNSKKNRKKSFGKKYA